jgi:MFS family permease
MVDTSTHRGPDIDPQLARLSRRARTWLLAVACMSVMLVISSMVALNAALGDIAVETTANQGQLTWIVDGYTLVLACLLLPAGALGDRYGRRGALLIGLAIFAAASGAPLVLDDPVQIIAARAVSGIGAAFIMPATLSLLTAATPAAERNKAVGIWAGVTGSAAIAGFLGTGVLLLFWSWRSIFVGFASAGIGLFVLACTIATSRDERATPLDWPGAVLIAGAVAAFVFGVLQAPTRGWSDPVVYGCMTAGAALAVVFSYVELRQPFPLLDVRLFGRPDFATGAVGITFLFFANFGFFFLAMQHLQLVMGYSPLRTALALSPLFVPVLALSATTYWYLPRIGLRLTVSSGLFLIAAGLLCMRLTDLHSTYLDIAWPLVVVSTGIGLCTAPTTSAIAGAVPTAKQGVASAVNDTTREVGAAIGIAVAGSMLATQYGHVLTGKLSAFPAQIREPATHSLAEALAVSGRIGPQGDRVADLAKAAFLQAMDSSLVVLAITVAVAAVLVGVWAPGRDGRQIVPVRRLSARVSGR